MFPYHTNAETRLIINSQVQRLPTFHGQLITTDLAREGPSRQPSGQQRGAESRPLRPISSSTHTVQPPVTPMTTHDPVLTEYSLILTQILFLKKVSYKS